MRRNLLLSFIIALCMPLLGNPVDENTAKQLAQNFWKENNIMGVRGDKVFKKKMGDARFVNVAPQCGYSEFYIFNNEDGKGFVIIAADDCVTPILGYSYDNNFAAENLPPNLKGWLDGYAEQIQAAVEMRVNATDDIRADWECLRRGMNMPIRSETQVYPLIATTWDQSPYYNALCPFDYYFNQRTVTGCVATAMAQIMKYWSYPEHGLGSHSYIPQNHPEYGTQYADFSSTTYQWSLMPNNVSSSNTAVATLMYHCGVSVDMNYDVSSNGGSGAYVLDFGLNRPCAENALKTYFDYKSTLHGEEKDNYSDSQWIALLKNELNNARPILYAGFGTGGHAFVCDGYDPYDCFHFNWGWSGAAQGANNDAYYYINSLIPIGTSYNFSSNQQALIGIEPNNTSYNFNLVYYSTPIMSDDEYWFFDDMSVHAEVSNNGSGAFNGYIGAGVYYEEDPGSGTYYFLDVMDYWDWTSNPLSPNYHTNGDLDCAGGPPYIPGSYLIAMLYSMDGDLWNFIDLGSYDYAYFDIYYYQNIEKNSDFSILTGDFLYNNTDATVNVDIWNTGSETFYGKFRVNLANSDGSWVQNIGIFECNEGLPANYHYTNGLDFTGTITAPSGTYLMELAYQEAGSSSWYYAGASNYQNPVWVYVAPEPVYADIYEPNNSQSLAYSFTPSFSGNSATVNTTGSNLHNSSDIDYYKINLNAGYDYTISPRLHDAFNSGNGNTYSVDGMFAYSTDGVNWSDFIDDVMTGNISVIDGGTVYFDVISYFEGDIGTYLLSVGITRTQHNNSFTISVSANPSNGGTVSGGGTYNQGQSCTVSATANSGYTFFNWTENGTQVSSNANYTFTVTGNRNLVANFQAQPQQYTINVSANPSNGGNVTGGGSYNQGQSCTVSATANSGYTFVNWTENGTQVSSNANYTFTVNGNRNLVANFQAQPQQYTISVSANPSNGGNVTGGGTYNQGQSCTVSATANSGYTFVNWTENGTQVSTNANYTFTVTSNRNLVAHFTTQGYVITAIAEPSVGGVVTGSGGYNYGETCTLTATANTGYTFQRWTKNGTPVSTNPTYSFTVTESATYTAHFNAQSYTITVAANPSNAGSVSGGGSYTYGQTCTVTASANNGYAFTNWTENGSQVSTNASYSFTVTGNRNLVANFAQNTHSIHASAGANGIITPSGTITVAHGVNQSFSMIPDSDYEVQEVYIDGNPIGAMTSYTFTNVTADHYIHVTFTHVDAIEENNSTTINVYPNPTKGEVIVEGKGMSHIRIVNTYGQIVYSSNVVNEQVRIDLSDIAKGIYMMHIEANYGQVMKKVVVE